MDVTGSVGFSQSSLSMDEHGESVGALLNQFRDTFALTTRRTSALTVQLPDADGGGGGGVSASVALPAAAAPTTPGPGGHHLAASASPALGVAAAAAAAPPSPPVDASVQNMLEAYSSQLLAMMQKKMTESGELSGTGK